MDATEKMSGLSGEWSGEFWDGAEEGLTSFAANIVDTTGSLVGTTIEPDPDNDSGELSAVLTGVRHGYEVSFVKVYDAAGELGVPPISFSGTANAALDVVKGKWVQLERNPLRGGFAMHRISPRR
jgi:hypothetical protein